MVNIFKKISRGSNNLFKKINKGSANFFKKLPGQIEHAADVVKGGLNKGLDVVGDVARKVGNTLEKAAPMIAMGASAFMPALAPAIMGGMTAATSLSKQIQSGARAGQGTVNDLAQKVNNKSASLSNQADRIVNQTSNRLQNEVNNRLDQSAEAYDKINFH